MKEDTRYGGGGSRYLSLFNRFQVLNMFSVFRCALSLRHPDGVESNGVRSVVGT